MAAASLSGALARDDHFALATLAAATARPTVADPGPAFRPRPPAAPPSSLPAEHLRAAI